ncbi:MAG: ROK family protein [Anaerolineales bacterium]
MSSHLIAVDLGGTNMRIALFDGENLTPSQASRVPTHAKEGPDSVISRMIEAIEKLSPDGNSALRIGVGAPGPLDPRAGVVLEAPNLPGWVDIHLKERLKDHFDCPVAIGNDANLAALAEWKHGAGRGTDNLIYLTISTGVGGGVICDGHLLLGARGIAAELGHITVVPGGPLCGCGQRGHLEAVASGPAIARRAQALLDGGANSSLAEHNGELTATDVGHAAESGDVLAIQVFDEAAAYLGQAMANFAHLFNPQIFILGGGVAQVGPLLFDPTRAALDRQIMDPSYLEGLRIEPAALGDDAGLIGAMTLAAEL